jgi:TRAP-type C4-dicarboxylate transport system permease small subunit
MSWLKKIDRLLSKVEKGLVVALFATLVLALAFNIVSRNLFDRSFQKVLELAPALVVWLALLGSTLALKENRHIRLEILLRFCPATFQKGARVAVNLFGMAVMGLLLYASADFVRNEVEIFGPWGWLSVIFPIFFAVALFRFFTQLFFLPARGPTEETPAG